MKKIVEVFKGFWSPIMDSNENPLKNITNLKIRHMIMQILAFMWSGVFSLYIVDSIFVFGFTAIAHALLIAPIWNFRMPAILEGWIDKVLAPPWAFTFKQLVGNYGYPQGNLGNKKAIIFCTYGSPRLAITTFFLNLPIRRLKRGVFHICGIKSILYKRYFAVPFVADKVRKKFLKDVKDTATLFQ